MFSWYAEGSSTSCVRVDKNGVGLLKLWHQQLRQFSLVGVEVAQAVAREYPGPRALMQVTVTICTWWLSLYEHWNLLHKYWGTNTNTITQGLESLCSSHWKYSHDIRITEDLCRSDWQLEDNTTGTPLPGWKNYLLSFLFPRDRHTRNAARKKRHLCCWQTFPFAEVRASWHPHVALDQNSPRSSTSSSPPKTQTSAWDRRLDATWTKDFILALIQIEHVLKLHDVNWLNLGQEIQFKLCLAENLTRCTLYLNLEKITGLNQKAWLTFWVNL